MAPRDIESFTPSTIVRGTLAFSIESRILRELGERLVKQPEVAIVELIKNAYDADANECSIDIDTNSSITVIDDGQGMTLDQFEKGWMRVGTSSKELVNLSKKFSRIITGEKGIGRFAVRFLGQALHLETVADDQERGVRTQLTADFDWPSFDQTEDLGGISVPYVLYEVGNSKPTGTTLQITELRSAANRLNLKAVRTGTIGMLSPLRSLFKTSQGGQDIRTKEANLDPGFLLNFRDENVQEESADVASQILDQFVLRATLTLQSKKVDLRVFRRGNAKHYLRFLDTYENETGDLSADIRFFPHRAGTFAQMPVDGRRARSWISENKGIAIFDRKFRVPPYGDRGDDWLQVQADAVINRRTPRSRLAEKHFPMDVEVRNAPGLNWMIRLPQSHQLVGLVQVEGRRVHGAAQNGTEEGLVVAADREGFIDNIAFRQLCDLVRGAVEAIAFADRRIQQEEEEAVHQERLASIEDRTRTAIAEVEASPDIAPPAKKRLVSVLAETSELSTKHQEASRERELQLEVMSLLGVVAGFMTHEFGVALQELGRAHKALLKLAKKTPEFQGKADDLSVHISKLRDFVSYSTAYIQGARSAPDVPYPVKPRLQQVRRIFGEYANQRKIKIEISVERELKAPSVPASLYNGIALNLYTNALKAVTAKKAREQGKIVFRAWNHGAWHYLEVSDTGIGIPSGLHERVFDPLFTTTQSRDDPLGSGMGLGLPLVRRTSEAFGGSVEFVTAASGFATAIRVRLPLQEMEQ